MSGSALVVTIGGFLLAGLGLFALARPEPAIRRGDARRISLIEFGMSKIDPDFRPLAEQPWERKFDRFFIWISLIGGLALAGIGLTSD